MHTIYTQIHTHTQEATANRKGQAGSPTQQSPAEYKLGQEMVQSRPDPTGNTGVWAAPQSLSHPEVSGARANRAKSALSGVVINISLHFAEEETGTRKGKGELFRVQTWSIA